MADTDYYFEFFWIYAGGDGKSRVSSYTREAIGIVIDNELGKRRMGKVFFLP